MSWSGRSALGLLGLVLLGSLLAGTLAAGVDQPTGASSADQSGPPSTTQPTLSASDEASAQWAGTLLPDVRSLPARRPQVRGRGDDRRLRFDAWLANDGPGPLVVRPRRAAFDCPAEQRPVVQVLTRDTDRDGRYVTSTDRARAARPAGCMLDHPTHDHWHLDTMAAYRLLPLGSSQPVAAVDKVSFCLRDNERVPGAAREHGRTWEGDCGRSRPQGISPGWADIYDRTLDGQSLDLPPTVPDGTYCLVLEADPDDLLVEGDETDNSAALGLQLRGREVDVDPGLDCSTG